MKFLLSTTSALVIGSLTPAALADNSSPATATAEKSETANKNVVEIAAANSSFETLVAAVKTADLAETLSGPGPFTIFAPTDEAFAKLPDGTVEGLLKPENKEQLQQILKLHVIGSKVMAADVKSGQVETVAGQPVDVSVSNGKVTVSGANVIKTDIIGSNGVIHVIDSVILPAS